MEKYQEDEKKNQQHCLVSPNSSVPFSSQSIFLPEPELFQTHDTMNTWGWELANPCVHCVMCLNSGAGRTLGILGLETGKGTGSGSCVAC